MASLRYIRSRKRWQVRWYCTVQQGSQIGLIIDGSQTFRKKQAAIAFKAEIEQQEDYWRAGLEINRTLITDALDLWTKHISHLTPRTQQFYKSAIKSFSESLPPTVVTIDQISARYIEAYREAIRNRGCKAITCNRQTDPIRSFCTWLSDRYDIPNVGAKIRPYKEAPREPRFLTDEEYEAVLKVTPDYEKDITAWLANTGLRASEFCNLTWKDISRDRKSVTVFGKGRKYRVVLLNEACRDIQSRLKRNPNKPIFLSKSNKKLSRFALRNYIIKLSHKAGINNFGPHSLRHYFGTQLILKGVSIAKVSKLMGHSSIAITEHVYIHILPKDLAGTTDCLK